MKNLSDIGNLRRCLCQHQRQNPTCKQCAENYFGANCEVDTNNSLFIDGTFFYVEEFVDTQASLLKLWRNISSANTLCASKGMHLLTIKTKSKNHTISEKLNLPKAYGKCAFFWLGLMKNPSDDKPSWNWIDDNSPLSDFQNWKVNEDDSDGSEETSAAFSIYYANYAWITAMPNINGVCVCCEYMPLKN